MSRIVASLLLYRREEKSLHFIFFIYTPNVPQRVGDSLLGLTGLYPQRSLGLELPRPMLLV